MNKLKKCAFFFFFINAAIFAQQKNLPQAYSSQAVKAFADNLFSNGFFDEAESEFKRFLFTNDQFYNLQDNSKKGDNSSQKIDALYSLTSIFYAKNDKNGAKWLIENFYKTSDLLLDEKMNLLYARLIFKEQNSADFSTFYKNLADDLQSFSPQTQILIPLSDFLLKKDINSAKDFCQTITDSALKQSFKDIINGCNKFNQKSPGFALFLSALFPGAGKWYTGSFQGGLSSLLYTTSFAAGTAFSVYKFGWQDWRPYVFGSATICFYVAELYGAYKSAQRYNQNFYEILYKQTDKLYEENF